MSDARPGAVQTAPAASRDAPPPWNVLAIVALVGAFAIPVSGIVCGHIALRQIRHTGEQGYGLALAGTILGWVLSALILLFVIVWIGAFVSFLGVFLAIANHVPQDTLNG